MLVDYNFILYVPVAVALFFAGASWGAYRMHKIWDRSLHKEMDKVFQEYIERHSIKTK